MLPCVSSVIDHRKRQNMVRTSVTHSPYGSCATFLFLPKFYHVICDLLLNSSTATWKLFVLHNTIETNVELTQPMGEQKLTSTGESNSRNIKQDFWKSCYQDKPDSRQGAHCARLTQNRAQCQIPVHGGLYGKSLHGNLPAIVEKVFIVLFNVEKFITNNFLLF